MIKLNVLNEILDSFINIAFLKTSAFIRNRNRFKYMFKTP